MKLLVRSSTRMPHLILPHGAQRNGGGGPPAGRWRGRSVVEQIKTAGMSSASAAPSTMLRMVPLPLFAGADGIVP